MARYPDQLRSVNDTGDHKLRPVSMGNTNNLWNQNHMNEQEKRKLN